MYLHFLILCGIFCDGIIAKLSNEDTRESLDFLVRKRRVITHVPGGLTSTQITQANYMVAIKKNSHAHCAGAILSHYTVITAAVCVNTQISDYIVHSGQTYEGPDHMHLVTSKDEYYGHPPHQQHDGIALITIDRPFVYTIRTGPIALYMGPVVTGTQVTVRGWGGSYPPNPGPIRDARGNVVHRALRTITLPVMNHGECQHIYRAEFTITDKNICTFDEHQYCARTDEGAPLVVNNQLAGIFVWKGSRIGHRNPDVFINLQLYEYSSWIRSNTLLM